MVLGSDDTEPAKDDTISDSEVGVSWVYHYPSWYSVVGNLLSLRGGCGLNQRLLTFSSLNPSLTVTQI